MALHCPARCFADRGMRNEVPAVRSLGQAMALAGELSGPG
jgi:hypothetical protein